MACYDSDGNEVPCPDNAGDQSDVPPDAPPPDPSTDNSGDQPSPDAPPPLSPAEIGIFGGGTTDQSGQFNPTDGSTPSDSAPLPIPGGDTGPAPAPGAPQPGPSPSPGPAPAPVPSPSPNPSQPQPAAPPGHDPNDFSAYLRYLQQQADVNASRYAQGLSLQQKDLDLRTAIANATAAYQTALIQTRNVELAQNAARDAMTRDFQMQDLQFRRQQNAANVDIEREKLDLQRRLLPASRTTRRAATVQNV